MKRLTAKQETFAQNVAINKMFLVDAYRASYDVKPEGTYTTHKDEAYKVARLEYVAARIQELRDLLVMDLQITKGNMMEMLKDIGTNGILQRDRIRAIVELCKLADFYPQQTIDNVTKLEGTMKLVELRVPDNGRDCGVGDKETLPLTIEADKSDYERVD